MNEINCTEQILIVRLHLSEWLFVGQKNLIVKKQIELIGEVNLIYD